MKLGDFMDYIYVTCSTDVFMNLASKGLRIFSQDFPSLPIKIEKKYNIFSCLNKKLLRESVDSKIQRYRIRYLSMR